MTAFSVVPDCLRIGAITPTRLVQYVDTTPFYGYDRGPISARIVNLRRSLLGEVLA
jgi:hypothetical protein